MKRKTSKVLLVVLAVGLVAGVATARRQGLWTLDLKHKGFMSILVDSPAGPVAYYYISYRATNTTGEERTIAPQGKIVTETGQTLYAAPAPKAAYAICKRHNRAMLDINQMAAETIPDGESRWGLYIFTGLDDKADRLDVYLYGLSNAYKYTDEDNRTGLLRKVYKMTLARPGDADNRHLDKVKVVDEGWVWIPPDVKTGEE